MINFSIYLLVEKVNENDFVLILPNLSPENNGERVKLSTLASKLRANVKGFSWRDCVWPFLEKCHASILFILSIHSFLSCDTIHNTTYTPPRPRRDPDSFKVFLPSSQKYMYTYPKPGHIFIGLRVLF